MKKILFLTLSVCYLNSFGQKTNTTDKDVFKSQEIIFYGYDYSHFKLAEAKRLTDGNIKKYIPAWIDFLNGKINEKDLENSLKKEKVTFNFDYTMSLIKPIKEDDLVTITKHSISSDSIQSIISNYQLKEKDGIGFVVIPECFEKNKNRCTAYFTFFDIATKKIIMSDYFGSNDADGKGLTDFWGHGLHATFAKYLADVYKNKFKAYKNSL